MNALNLLFLPVLFGLVGFLEPCSIGSTLLVVKQIERCTARQQIVQTLVFAGTRALLIGAAGLAAALFGSVFLGAQKAAWLVLGIFYIVLGVLYMRGRVGWLMRAFGPHLRRMQSLRGSVMLGLFFGLNIPACAAPLILALLGAAAAGSANGATLAGGFLSLAVFGLALSLPLVVAVFFEPARRGLDWLAAQTRRLPLWTGALFIGLGAWSIWFSLFVSLK